MNNQEIKEFLDKALQDIRYICGVDQHDPDYETIQLEPILKSVFDCGAQAAALNESEALKEEEEA
jgi:hypothetical protein